MLIEAPLTKPFTLDEFTASLAALAPFESRPFLTVAVSGGPDSLALAILADRWARERGGRVCAVTVDHRLRRESGREIRLLHGWLSARSIRHEILAWSGDKPEPEYRRLRAQRAIGCLPSGAASMAASIY